MADSNPQRRVDAVDILDDDPFAELTRIMGHDPRADAAPQPSVEAADDGGRAGPEIDLEQELLGDLDLAEFDEPQSAGDWRDDMRAGAQADDGAATAVSVDDRREEAVSAEIAEETPGEEWAYAPAVEEEFDLELDLDAQSVGWEDEPFVEVEHAEPAPVAQEAHAQPAAGLDDFETGFDDDDLGDALERELYSAAADDRTDEPPARGLDPAPAYAAAGHDDSTMPGAADPFEEPDFDFLMEDELPEPDEPAASPAASGIDWRDEPADDPDAVEPDTQAAAASSLEDELNHLLSSHGFAAGDAAEADVAPPPAAGAFSRVNFAAPRPVETGTQPAAGFDAPVAMLDDEDLADIFGDGLELNDEPAEAQAPAWQPSYEPAAASRWTPEPHGTDDVPAEEPEDDVLAHWQPEPLAPAAAASHWTSAAPAAAPEIETQDVAESAQMLADDLDIPDVDFADEPAAPGLYDDLEGDFAQAMGDLSFDDRPAPAGAAPSSGWAASPAAFAAAPVAAMPGAAFDDPLPAAGGDDPSAASWQDELPMENDPLDFDAELEHAITMASYDSEEAQAQPSRRRGVLVAAVVAGVAIVGGAGVFGMSLFGGGSDAPAVVRADADPMKVRPENPGGTTVPNQDNEVYQRVGGAAADAAPEQERLITTAEEPVDLAAQAEEPALLPPGVSDGADDIAAIAGEAMDEVETALAPAMPKAEDRVPAGDDVASGPAAEEALVTPRRVRTMIVRPDGTMVAREDPAPAARPVEEETAQAAAPTAGFPTLEPAGQTAPVEQGFEDDGGPVVETPPTVSVVPSQRTEPTATAQPAPVQQAAPVAQPAVQQPVAQAPVVATPVSAPAAAAPTAAGASEWSMQIASQPTAESAQATYQDLARRYGGVLEGRGVNIVRADIADKGVYYRVRIPASSRDEAIQLCTRYKSAGGSCFVSR